MAPPAHLFLFVSIMFGRSIFTSLRIAARSLRRRGRTTLLSVGGLAIGVAVCLLAGLYVWTQYSYDHHHKGADRIIRIHEEGAAYTYDEVWFDLTDNFSGDAQATAFVPRSGVVQTRTEDTSTDASTAHERARRVDRLYYASPSVFDVFTYPLAQGDPTTALQDPASAVLSHEMAQAIFPDQNPIGRTIAVPGEDDLRTLTVTGVMEPLPQTLHVRPDILVPLENLKRESGGYFAWMYVYVRTAGSTAAGDVTAWLNERRTARQEKSGQAREATPLRAQPLLDIYLHSDLREEIAPTGSFTYVLAFGIVGLLVLVIACVNYVIMTTAQVAERMRSVGLRKTFGATRGQVARHFLAESALVTGLSVAVGAGLTSLAVPGVNRLAPDPISLERLWSLEGAFLVLGITLLTTLLAGAYPATYLSALQPVRLFRGGAASCGDAGLQRGLVVMQFTLSIALTAVTVVVVQQTQYVAQKDLGLDREHTLMVNTRFAGSFGEYGVLSTEERRRRLDRIETVLEQRSDVRSTGRMAYRPNSDYVFTRSLTSMDPGGPAVDARLMFGTEGVSRAMGIPMVAGQRLDETPQGILINRAAADKLGDAGTVGATVRLSRMRDDTTTVIAGIMENFHYQSLRTQITPAFLAPLASFRSDDYLFVRATSGRADADIRNLIIPCENLGRILG